MKKRFELGSLYFVLLTLFALQAVVFAQNPTASSAASLPNETKKNKERNETPRREIQFNYGFESLTNGYGEWRTASLDFTEKFKTGQVLYGSLLTTERFTRRDRQATIGFYQPFNRVWTLQVEAGASPTHRILPKWTAFAGIERKFKKGWNASAAYRRTEYKSAKVNLFSAGAEKYFGNCRAAYTLYVSNLATGGTSLNHRFQFNRFYGEQTSSVGIGAGFGRELESLGNRGVLQTAVRSVGISGRHWVNRRWGINYDASYTQQGKFYTRRGMSIGVRFRF